VDQENTCWQIGEEIVKCGITDEAASSTFSEAPSTLGGWRMDEG
jgi:hypothetical protein